MGVSVVAADEEAVVLRAPLGPNINHRETVFGGSASALAILVAWSLLHLRLRRAGIAGRLVIQRNTMEYDLPVTGEFTARASAGQGRDWQRFTRMLERRGRARYCCLVGPGACRPGCGQVYGRVCGLGAKGLTNPMHKPRFFITDVFT